MSNIIIIICSYCTKNLRKVNYTLQEEPREYLDKYKGLIIEGR
jgi:hypothetical protein